MIRRERLVIPMQVLTRRRAHQIREPIEKLKRQEFDDVVGSGPRRLSCATPADPSDAGCRTVHAATVFERSWEAAIV